MTDRTMLSKVEEGSCDLCGPGEESTIVRRVGVYGVRRCLGCGVLYLSPRPTDSELREIYSSDYYKIGATTKDERRGYSNYLADELAHKKYFSKLVEKVDDIPPGRLLEIGSALGFFLAAMKQRGWNVLGLEMSAYCRDYAQERWGIDIDVASFQSGQYPDGSFDMIAHFATLEHFPKPFEALTNMYRLLKPGGTLFFTIPDLNAICLANCIPGYRFLLPEHLYFFSKSSIGKFLKNAGFKKIDYSTNYRYFLLSRVIERVLFHLRLPGRRHIGGELSNSLLWASRVCVKLDDGHAIIRAEKPLLP